MLISATRERLEAGLLSFVWDEWSQMGLLSEARRLSPWAQDPEALLLLTLEVARADPRLFDEVLDWLVRNEHLVSVRRLRTLTRRGAESDAHRCRAGLARPAPSQGAVRQSA